MTVSSSQHRIGLRAQGNIVRFLPSTIAPAPPDLDNRITNSRLLAMGLWSDDMEGHIFCFSNLKVTVRGDAVLDTQLEYLRSWEHKGEVTDVQVCDTGGGEVIVAIASSSGGVTLGRLLVPRTAGASPEDVQILHMPAEEDCLESWVEPHKGAVASVDIQSDSKSILTVGADGAIYVLDPNESYSSGRVPAFKRSPGGYCSYTNGRWADSQLFATTSSTSGLEIWDIRQGGKPISNSSPKGRGAQEAARQVHWLQVHPSRPDVCATGGARGTVALWDLRFSARPLFWSPPSSSNHGSPGDVWQVKFDMSEPESALSASGPSWGVGNRLLFATEDGQLGRAAACKVPPAPSFGPLGGVGASSRRAEAGEGDARLEVEQPLLQEHSAIHSFDVDPVLGRHVVCVTDSQDLVYLHQPAVESTHKWGDDVAL